jgi:predicted ATP-grasp superfamily ATP-dependent carboligase
MRWEGAALVDILSGAVDTSVAAFVLKLGRYRLHHGGLAVIRTLGRLGVTVVGVHEDRWAPAAMSRYLTHRLVPPAGTSTDAVKALLEAAVAATGMPTVVIATDDDAALALDQIEDPPPGCLLTRCVPGLRASLVQKDTCHELAQRLGLPTPAQRLLRCPLSDDEVDRIRLPVVIKRVRRALLPDGSRTFSTVLATRPGQLRETLQDARFGPYEILAQEAFEGDDWLYHAYCDAESRPLVAFTGRKLRSFPAGAGETAYGQLESDAEVRAVAEAFLEGARYVGPVSMDLRRDSTGRVVILDVNPRVGACFRLFENEAGVDVVRAMHLDLSGRPVPSDPPLEGRTYVVEPYDRAVRGAYGLGRLAWWRELAAVDERAWFAADDPIPALAVAAQSLAHPSPGLLRRRG